MAETQATTSAYATARRQLIELPEDCRIDRPVPCRQCVTAMLKNGPGRTSRRAADTIRDGRVACTAEVNHPTRRRRARIHCLECSVCHDSCAPVDAFVAGLAADLAVKYKAAFGKGTGSVEYIEFLVVANACREEDGSVKEGLKAKDRHRKRAQKGQNKDAAAMTA